MATPRNTVTAAIVVIVVAASTSWYPTTAIRYDVPAGGANVELAVFDVGGRLVRRLASGFEPSGYKRAYWDGRNENGQLVPSGVYFYRLVAGDFVQSRKMAMLK